MTLEEAIAILKAKIEGAKKEDIRRSKNGFRDDGEITGEINAYNDCLSLFEQVFGKEEPVKVICDNDDPNCELPVGNHDCPRCGYGLETLVVDGNDRENIPSHFHYCPNCGQRLEWDDNARLPTDAEKEDLFKEDEK